MTRRSALPRRALLAGFPAILRAQRRRPNILLLLADNWAAPHASILGDPVVRTPAFDRIANEGVLFTGACSPNPSCSPARSSILTGQETHRLEDAANLYGPLALRYPRYPQTLEQAGYVCGYAGKAWGPGQPPADSNGRRRNPVGDAFPDFGKFLAAKPAEKPFCFWFGSNDPHVPWTRGQERRSKLDAAKLKVPAHLPDWEVTRQDMLGYYAEVEEFDADCGRILETLKSAGELDNTLVVVTSDNGWQMPRGLANCYTLGVRVPMAMRYPERIAKGTVREDFASLFDLAPTFLDAAGLPAPKGQSGASLFGPQRRKEIFLERERHANVRKGDLGYPVRGVLNKRYLYLRNLEPERWPAGDPEHYWAVGPYGDIDDGPTKRRMMREKPQPHFDLCFGKRPPEELYDLATDPDQTKNLAAEASAQKVKRDLSAKVTAHMKRSGDPRASGPTDFWDRVPYTGPKFGGAPID
ncbi:MAG: sulfatase [Bryobacteraceae bacterium]|nr:sulfatase [Bryobacteraceae bacterium]